jgi:hypothetical protein
MVEFFLLVAMPFIVTLVTGVTKQVSLFANSSHRVAMIRGLVALFSLLGAILTTAIGEGTLDNGMIQASFLAIFNGVVATWFYFYSKKSS